MAIGVEKLKDSGFSGLVSPQPPSDGTSADITAPASFSLLAPAYAKKYGVDEAEMNCGNSAVSPPPDKIELFVAKRSQLVPPSPEM